MLGWLPWKGSILEGSISGVANCKLLRENLEKSASASFRKGLVLHAKESELDPVSDKESLAGI